MQMARNTEGFFAATAVATLAGLIGLGGAEFRLPLLKGWFRLPSLKAVIFNKATSLVVVAFALLFRAHEIPFAMLLDHIEIVLNLLGGSLIGAWISAGLAMRISEERLDTIIMLLLLALAGLLLFDQTLMSTHSGMLFENLWAQRIAGVIAGFGIGMVAAILGVAGGELLIPTIVLLYGIDIKLAGSLSLAISLPTMLVGFFRYSQGSAFAVLKEERELLTAMVLGSIAGAGIGSMLLGVIPTGILTIALAIVLIVSAVKIFRHKTA
jgi:uncharacterized membrane protein YfcA